MKSKNFVLATVSCLIGLVAALLVAEGMLRVAGVQSRLVYTPNAYYGWGEPPGYKFVWSTESQDQQITINSLGLRDFEYPYRKPDDTFRILVLGDSFAEALQVPLDHSFSKVLEHELNDGKHGTRKVEVINAGVSGYGTDNELLFFTHEGYKYQPDLVLIAFYLGNDVRNNWYPLEERDAGGQRKPYYDMGPEGLVLKHFPFVEHESWTTRVKVFLNRHSRLYTFSRELRDRLAHGNVAVASNAAPSIPFDFEVFLQEPPPDWDKAWQVTAGVLEKLKTEAASHDAKVLVVAIPTAFQVQPQILEQRFAAAPALRTASLAITGPNERLAAICEAAQIPLLDLLTYLQGEASQSDASLYLTTDHHWNAAGHRAAGLRMTQEISRYVE